MSRSERERLADARLATLLGEDVPDADLPAPSPRWRERRAAGGHAYDGYSATGDLARLEEAVEALCEAVLLAPGDDPGLPALLVELAYAVHWRAELDPGLSGRTPDQEAADVGRQIAAASAAVRLADPWSPEALTARLHLASGLRKRAADTGESADLDRAVQVLEEALPGVHPRHHQRPTLLNILGNTLAQRYDVTGARADIDRAIEVQREAVARAPDALAFRLKLAQSLQRRFDVTGSPGDVDLAIDLLEEAARGTDVLTGNHLASANLAGGMRFTRYQMGGSYDDLLSAIEHFQRARDQTPATARSYAWYLRNFALAVEVRYHVTGDRTDLDTSVTLMEEAARLLPPGHPSRESFLGFLAESLRTRGNMEGDLADLDRSVATFLLALESAVHPGERLRGLAHAYLDRSRAGGGEPGDVDRAVEAAERALTLLGDDAVPVDRAARLTACARARAVRHDLGAETSGEDLRQATSYFRQACVAGLEAAPGHAREAAEGWGVWAAGRGAWAEAVEAYEHGLIAARRLAATQLSPGSRLHSLALHGSQFSRAAYALARAGRLTDAVVVLEQNRTRLLSESTGRDAADLGGLDRIGKGRLRRRFSEAAARLRLLELPRPEGAPSITEAEARRARADFDEVVAEIRRLPGYERLLSPPDVADLRLEALPAPVVFLVATVWGGMALAAGAGRAPAVIWLPALDETVVHARVSAYLDVYGDRTSGAAWQAAVDEITQWSWESMIGPVLAALPGEEHLILVPTQLLGLLPLHAAWHGTGARHYACDDVLLTYGANIRLLHREPRPAATVLTVGPPPSTLAPLPYASREIPYVQAAFPRHRALVDEAATVGNVLAEAGRHDVLHLACHGLTHPTEPLDSGLLLAGDQWLTLPRLLTGGELRGRLAVLSACETALAHPQSGDEALTLPGVLLSTGLSGAIGSLWAVPDLSTALLMARFYSLWPGREPSPARALRQAQRWLRGSTNAEKLAAFPGLLGDVFDALPAAARTLWGRARQHAHPYHWAGFVYYGA